jgi:N utilization substance protein A
MKSDFLIALTQLAAERHLPKEQVLQAIEVALASAFKKDNPASGQNISVKLNPNTGDVDVFALRTVVEVVEDPAREIELKEAQAVQKSIAIGEELASPEPVPHNASRIAAQTAKQVVLQRLREAERELLFQEFVQHKDDIISGMVEQVGPGRTVVLELGRAQAIMPPDEQVPTERYRKGQRVKVFVVDVRNSSKGPEILVSRSHKNLLKRLFEIEVPEVYNGVVEIKAIAREAGFRSKVAVFSTQEGIDPVGSCIGIRGNRIQSIVNELQGEKIDVVPWDNDPKAFIGKALSPSEVVHVELEPNAQTATVVVPDRQLSLAIGKEGQNARLASRLAGWRLDIKGLTEWEEIKETRQKQLEEERLLVPDPTVEEESEEAVAEAEAIIEAAQAPDAVPGAKTETEETVAEVPQAEVVGVIGDAKPSTAEALDEDAVLAALILEEESAGKMLPETAEATASLSVEELESFTIEDVVEEDEEDYEDEEVELDGELVVETSVLTPDAGKIRFAEDIVGDHRGGAGRRARGARRGGAGAAARGGVRRGPGPRPGPARGPGPTPGSGRGPGPTPGPGR